MPTSSAKLEVLPKLDARIPHWPMDSLSERACPLCRNFSPPLLIRPDLLPVAFCQGCHLWYVCQLPPAEAIANFYQTYWTSVSPQELTAKAARRLLKSAALTSGKDDVRLQRLCALLGDLKGKRVLEVGCGFGSFLVTLRARGAEVIGNDLSEQACRFLRQHLGITAHAQPLSECAGEIGPVDAIVMSDLIEHPPDPLHLLCTARELLGRNGLLLLWTPNGAMAGTSLDSARDWVGLRVNLEHLQYFSPESMVRLSVRHGWSIAHLETLGFPGLTGIDQEPVPPRVTFAYRLFDHFGEWPVLGRLVPYANRARRSWRVFRSEMSGKNVDADRTGTYHLLVILRPISSAIATSGRQTYSI